MANPSRPSRYAPASPGDRLERQALSELGFLGASQREYCLNPLRPIQLVRDELHRIFPDAMAALDARIMAGPQPAMAAAPRVQTSFVAPDAQAAQGAQDRLDQIDKISKGMGTGPYSPDAIRTTTYDARTCVQKFGAGVAR